ncbi:hypothetical protein K450DRAFT_237985 [Umbelopsis ramanniana AG]|uniref:ER-golgi trafficking TRAPP I complex 85 kDa subunit-domain-containing protein n=1 Tax=Umbelopsis ramanniana AG TaxID=1314678 RepID=A0AAD5EBS9_UMBRA|nr:uncharacterized protein K450DRAFT_237985 [Umbelopsis ramanniana AG]KAI8580324.1 hypothetical protein K450DRAFT_237985 [Umbelopsis ramanniana AG]
MTDAGSRPLPGLPPGSPVPISRSPTMSPSLFQQTPRDTISRSFCPVVAVAASSDANDAAKANNLGTFIDLIQPFGDLIEGRVSPRDSQGLPNPIENFNIRFEDFNNLGAKDHRAVFRVIDDYVKNCTTGVMDQDLKNIEKAADIGDDYLGKNMDEMTPWYAEFRHLILSIKGISEHETFDHPVAIVYAVSSSTPDPMATMMELVDSHSIVPGSERGFIDPNILRYYVLIHDGHVASIDTSNEVLDKMKRQFGLHCHLLKLNTRPRDVPTGDLLSGEHTFNQDAPPQQTVEYAARQQIWSDFLTEKYDIESRLRAYSEGVPQSQDTVFTPANIPSAPSSPSVPNLSRSTSVSSNLAQVAHNVHAPLQSGPQTPSTEFSSFEQAGTGSEVWNTPISQSLQGLGLITTDSSPPDLDYGKYLTTEDIMGIKVFVREMVVQSLIPFMERNMQLWNEQVAAARRGLSGRFFGASRRLFGSSARSPNPHSVQSIPAFGPNIPIGTTTVTIYPHNAPEAQMRKLADFAFMLRDYKFALNIYEAVKRDYATDKAWKHHAGVQEMIGTCLLLANQPLPSKNEVDQAYEKAVQQYLTRCMSSFFATRSTVIYYELLKSRRMWREVPTALVRMTGEDSDLRSALFLEQAAHCFLRTPRPMVRKYGFHLIMAGHRFGKAVQRQHAFRCYTLSYKMFADHGWTLAEDHINFALGKHAFHLGDLETAVSYFTKLLKNSQQPPAQQVAYLREFLFIYKQYAAQVGIDPLVQSLDGLPLPVFDDRSVRVGLSNEQESSENEDVWLSMEKDMLDEDISAGVITGRRKALALRQHDDARLVCAVGEPATVHIHLFNPLQISISFSDIMLGCMSTDAEVSSAEDESSFSHDMIFGAHDKETDMYAFESFELQKIDELVLEPLERRTITLGVIPRKEGSIRIVGLHYTLNNLVHTFHKFEKKGRRLNDTKEHQMGTFYGPDKSLDIHVTSPMPLLDVAFHKCPELLLSGEVCQIMLEISNKGNVGLTALRVMTSHPCFFSIGPSSDSDKDVYMSSDTTEARTEQVLSQQRNELYNTSVLPIELPANDNGARILEPGTTTLIPLWIRGDRIGKHLHKFLFTYQSVNENKAIAHRNLRYTISTQVLPSLKINAFTRPSTKSLNEFILGIETENLQTVAEFQLNQLTAASPGWTITPLNIDLDSSDDMQSKAFIPPRQTTFTYYKIHRASHSENAEAISPERWTSNALEGLLTNSQKNEHPPPVDLHVTNLSFRKQLIPYDVEPLHSFSSTSRMLWRTNTLATQFPSILSKQQKTTFTMYETNDIDLSLFWEIPKRVDSAVPIRRGHHYIIGINLAVPQNPFQGKLLSKPTPRVMFEATAKERLQLVNSLTRNRAFKDESPVKIMVKCHDYHKHDFIQEGLVTIPITVLLKNCSWSKTVVYTLELLSSTDWQSLQSGKGAAVKPAQGLNQFHWSGSTLQNNTLKPNETVELTAHACFQQAGIYDVNRWRLSVQNLTEDGTPDLDSVPHIQLPTLPQIISIQ